MKNILVLITFFMLLLSNQLNAQIAYSPYVGTWQYQNGNQRFIVKIWEDEEGKFMGHYKMVAINNNEVETGVVFNSRKDYGNGNYSPQFALYGTIDPQFGLEGLIKDNTIIGYNDSKNGNFEMKIQNASVSPYTATWKITERRVMKIGTPEPNDFSIPTNIILTKVSNTVNLD